MTPIVFLILTIVMPADVPDKRMQVKQPDIETCWSEAKRFVEHGAPKSVKGAQGVMAGCAVKELDADDL
jgi:hypothetical protein